MQYRMPTVLTLMSTVLIALTAMSGCGTAKKVKSIFASEAEQETVATAEVTADKGARDLGELLTDLTEPTSTDQTSEPTAASGTPGDSGADRRTQSASDGTHTAAPSAGTPTTGLNQYDLIEHQKLRTDGHQVSKAEFAEVKQRVQNTAGKKDKAYSKQDIAEATRKLIAHRRQ